MDFDNFDSIANLMRLNDGDACKGSRLLVFQQQ